VDAKNEMEQTETPPAASPRAASEAEDLARFEPILTLFFAGRMPRMNHARHVALGNILRHVPHGRELMHLGIQVTAIRAGKAEKYSKAITDRCWDELDGRLPALAEFADALPLVR